MSDAEQKMRDALDIALDLATAEVENLRQSYGDRLQDKQQRAADDVQTIRDAIAAIPLAAAEPVVADLAMLTIRLARRLADVSPDDDLPDQARHFIKRKGLEGSPLRAAPDRAPSIAGLNIVLDDSLPVGVMEMRGANTVRCENVRAPSTDSATERDAERFRAAMRCSDLAEALYAAVMSHAPDDERIRLEFDVEARSDWAIAAMKGEAQ